MDERIYNVKEKTVELAVHKAAQFFGVITSELDIEVLQSPSSILGINISPAIVKASLKTPLPKEDRDGTFLLSFRPNGVVLHLVHPKGAGRVVSEDEIIAKLHRKNVKEIDFSKIADALVTGTGEMVIAPAQEEEIIDGRAEVTISEDKMRAYITLFPPDGGEELSYEKIMASIAGSGVVYGVDKEIIKNNIGVYGKKIKFARGRVPLDGEDGRIEYKIDFRASPKPKYLKDGSVDYYEIQNYKTVSAGDVIALYIKPTPHENGFDVTGGEIQASPGRDIPLPIGENVTLHKNGTNIISSVGGVAEIKSGKICVSNILVIDKNVDLSVGNINFRGNVRINGNVLACLSIIAEGSVEIMGTVESASITAGGDIKIKRGISGGKKGVLKAGGNVYAGFLENAMVYAGGSVFASSIIYCEVDSGESVITTGGKGIIYGGRIKATNKISAHIIGSGGGASTVLEMGASPYIRREYDSLKEQIEKLNQELAYISSAIDVSPLELNARQERIKSKLVADKIRKKFLLANCNEEISALEKTIESEPEGCVNVFDTIFPGTRIIIKTTAYTVSEPNTHISYRLKDGEVKSVPYIGK